MLLAQKADTFGSGVPGHGAPVAVFIIDAIETIDESNQLFSYCRHTIIVSMYVHMRLKSLGYDSHLSLKCRTEHWPDSGVVGFTQLSPHPNTPPSHTPFIKVLSGRFCQ